MERKVALVTGGAKGIGAEVVKVFAERGYSVIINYLTSEERAKALMTELLAKEVNCAVYKADVSVRAEVEGLYAWSKKCFGFVDTVINNAGVCHFSLATDDGEGEYSRVMGANFGGIYNVCGLFARDMISEGRGSIVNVSSIWGLRGASYESLYSASKSAVVGYTKALAKELKPSDVRVNCVAPGLVDTDMNAEFSEPERAEILKKMRLKRVLSAREVAERICFIAECGKTGLIEKVYS